MFEHSAIKLLNLYNLCERKQQKQKLIKLTDRIRIVFYATSSVHKNILILRVFLASYILNFVPTLETKTFKILSSRKKN